MLYYRVSELFNKMVFSRWLLNSDQYSRLAQCTVQFKSTGNLYGSNPLKVRWMKRLIACFICLYSLVITLLLSLYAHVPIFIMGCLSIDIIQQTSLGAFLRCLLTTWHISRVSLPNRTTSSYSISYTRNPRADALQIPLNNESRG